MNIVTARDRYAVLALCMVLGLILGAGVPQVRKVYAEQKGISRGAIDTLSRIDGAMAEIAAAVKPAVVNVSTTRTVKTPGIPNPFSADPFFRQFFGDAFGNAHGSREYKQASLGSGVIVDRDGYILTNNHVVKDADEIKIKLSDGREFKGKVIGTDPNTDLAVIKIDSNHLPVVKWGDSDRLRVGETVLAFGNPYGLSQTVTSGIVSATGRANVGIADYEDFIQTDAPINPGNSGGALINIRGELIGINTAIFSTSGGYQGIGFAIPSNMAKSVMDSLIKKGKVVRGWLGLSIQPITPELAGQFGLKDEKGALVGDVVEGSPAERAGLRRGDVVVEFDGKEVRDPAGLRNMAANTPPGKEATLKVLREGKPKTVKITIAEMPAQVGTGPGGSYGTFMGVHVQGITPEMRKALDIPNRIKGVIVTDIEEGSKAANILTRNDVIMEIDRKEIKNMKDYGAAVSHIGPDRPVLLLVYRSGATMYVTIAAR